MKPIITAILFNFLAILSAFGKDYQLQSPDKRIFILVNTGSKITWSIRYNQETILKPSQLAISLKNNIHLGIDPVLLQLKLSSIDETITAVVPVKSKTIANKYNELRLDFKGGYSVYFRAYNDGVAYRFETKLKQDIEVNSETADFDFGNNGRVFWPQESDPNFQSHFESLYKDSTINAFSNQQHAALQCSSMQNQVLKC
jgi:alpha-glucosidase